MGFPVVSADVNVLKDPNTDPPCCDPVPPGGCSGYFRNQDQTAYHGPFPFGGSLYAFTQLSLGSAEPYFTYNNHVQFLKSDDDGLTWVIQDIANSPIGNTAFCGRASPIDFNSATGILTVFYATPTPFKYAFAVFDCNSNTWGAPVVSTIVSGNGTIIATSLVKLSDGSFTFFYPSISTGDASYVKITAGAWGVPAVLLAAAGVNDTYNSIVDSSDTAYLVYATNANKLAVVTLASNGTIGTPALVASGDHLPDRTSKSLSIFNNTLIIPYTTGGAGAGTKRASFYQSATLPTLTFTSFSLHQTLPDPFPSDLFILQLELSGTIYFFWNQFYLGNDFTDSIVSLWYNTFDGATLSAPALAWDELTQPCTCAENLSDPGDYYIQGLSGYVDGTALRVMTFAAVSQDLDGGLVEFGIETAPPVPLSIICDNPPNGVVGTPYTHTFPASGGTPPYTFLVVGGALPSGLSLNHITGVLSGTPASPGTFSFTIQVTDADGDTAQVTCSITITAAPSELSLICNSPPGGFVGTAYSHQIGLTGGTPPYTVTITVGALPTGLSISSTGLIAGTPTVAGSFQFTVHVVDAVGVIANVTCTIVIVALPASECPDADQGGPG